MKSRYNKTIYDRVVQDFYMDRPGDRTCSIHVFDTNSSSFIDAPKAQWTGLMKKVSENKKLACYNSFIR